MTALIKLKRVLLAILLIFLFSCSQSTAPIPPTNGARIYFTGESAGGRSIKMASLPPYLKVSHVKSCVHCHGPKGKGGIWMTNEVKAPDVSYKNLTSDEAPYTGHKGHKAYNDDLIIRAVKQGIASDGRVLDTSMPRWAIEDDDMKDLIEFLKTL
jgi:mono/diheme cytochrome c family protein